jgi:hypothetical protein
VVRSELLDDPSVPIFWISHDPSSCDRDGSEPNLTKVVPVLTAASSPRAILLQIEDAAARGVDPA